ncbi:diguanylate cyclase [Clostridium aceticum]|uniref:Diguanylate cyclase n=1 Tax=Clostridium aceticum TaxID=84022 RepID=A0A0D8I9A5_9CLOT|nr:diguanylate cyclase [Clostridium aceticum]AKL95572.1 diguanylate cyclase [Clostridium aceticum]KJF26850.1 hypothetical protein TZ02_11640 [Clostridium aceticum]
MRRTKAIVSVVILAIILLLLLTKNFLKIDVDQGEVKKGEIIIERVEDDRAIALDGEWEFYWNQLIDPSEFTAIEETDIEYFTVPQLWKGGDYKGVPLSERGVATYRAYFQIDMSQLEENQWIAVKMPFVYSAYKLWLNGEVISTNGEIGLNREDEIPNRRPTVIMISPKKGMNEIVLQITNHHFYRGGISKSILIGEFDYLYHIREKQITLDIFMAGSFFISGILFLLLYFNRRKEKVILYFSFVCFIFLVRALITNEIYLVQVFKDFNWEIGNRIEAGFSYVGISMVLIFLGELYNNYFPVRYIKEWKVFAGSMLICIFFLPHEIYDKLMIYTNGVQTVYVVYLSVILIKNYDKSLIDFYVLLVGKIILVTLAIHDIIITYAVIDVSTKIHIGMYIYVFSLGYALILHLYREFGKVESLMIQNDRMLKEISKMNQGLEELVEKRTRELEATNKRLYELSMLDGLTRIPNRTSFNDKLEDYWHYALEEGLSLSIIFCDIDFFKNYNDNYGHIEGDRALQKIAYLLYKRVKQDDHGFIARYGGEEFVILYLNKDSKETYEVAEELRLLVKEIKISHEFSAIADTITISLGAISDIPDKQGQATDMLNQADQALYRAKQQGRNRTCMWNNYEYKGVENPKPENVL